MREWFSIWAFVAAIIYFFGPLLGWDVTLGEAAFWPVALVVMIVVALEDYLWVLEWIFVSLIDFLVWIGVAEWTNK